MIDNMNYHPGITLCYKKFMNGNYIPDNPLAFTIAGVHEKSEYTEAELTTLAEVFQLEIRPS